MVSAIPLATEQPALLSHWLLYTRLYSPQSSRTLFRMCTSPSYEKQRLTIASAGNDIAALMPRYITIKRGFFICAGMKGIFLSSRPAIEANGLSPLIRNLSMVSPLHCCNLYYFPVVLPNLLVSHRRYSNLRLLSHSSRISQYPCTLYCTPGESLPIPVWI